MFNIKFHGYDVGDRLLEDVYFQVKGTSSGWHQATVTDITVEDSAIDYFSQFNEEMWYKRIKEAVEANPYRYIYEEMDDYEWHMLIQLWGNPAND